MVISEGFQLMRVDPGAGGEGDAAVGDIEVLVQAGAARLEPGLGVVSPHVGQGGEGAPGAAVTVQQLRRAARIVIAIVAAGHQDPLCIVETSNINQIIHVVCSHQVIHSPMFPSDAAVERLKEKKGRIFKIFITINNSQQLYSGQPTTACCVER